jgi:hypothetical protein
VHSASFEFYVSATEADVFGWLRGRAAKSGVVLSGGADEARLVKVRWSPGSLARSGSAVDMEFAVSAVRSDLALVRVAIEGEAENPLAAIQDFAGPLGSRMMNLRARPREFFDPPRTPRDDIVMIAWAAGFVILLTVIVTTRHIPAAHEKMSGRRALVEFVLPLVLAGLAAGVAAGIAAHRRSRWFELPLLGMAFAVVGAFLVFDFWFISIDSGPGAGSDGSNFALAIGATICAVIEALIVLVGIAVGRMPAALAWSYRRLRAVPRATSR